MRPFIGLMTALFCIACVASQGESATLPYQYPLAPVKDRFSFFRERTSLPLATSDARGKSALAYMPADAWRVYFKHQTLRGFMDLNQVSVTFVDAKGAKVRSQKADAHFNPELHRLIVEASVNVAAMPHPRYVVIDTPESTTTFPVKARAN